MTQAVPVRRWIALGVLVVGLALFFACGGNHYVNFEFLRRHREELRAFVAAHGALACLFYVTAYLLLTALSFPGALVLTIIGGFLFGAILGAIYAMIGATAGATIVFLVARSTFGHVLRARAGPWLDRMRRGFQKNALSYLLVLRLVPLFPFWLVNLVSACLGMSVRAYVAGTFLGILPSAAIYASLGSGLGKLLDAGETPEFGIIFEPRILLPLIGLAILALLPVVYKGLKMLQR